MKRADRFLLFVTLVVVALAPPAVAQVTTELRVAGDQATASVMTPLYGLDVTLAFEEAVGLSPSSVGISARVVDPLEPGLLARLPSGVTVPAALPLLLEIEPPASGSLSFAGVATLELYTHDLEFTAGCPFRIFASHGGGTFEDITDFMGTGSYRGRGRTGGFSDFLILADTRPITTVVESKFDRVWAILEAHASAIEAQVYSDLHQILATAEAAWQAGDATAARSTIEAFGAAVEAASGDEIPDVWRSARDLVNVAGELRAAAATLRFSLSLAG